MHIEFCAKLNFLEGEYAIMQNIGFLLSWVGNPCRYLVLRPCKIRTDFVDVLLAPGIERSSRALREPAVCLPIYYYIFIDKFSVGSAKKPYENRIRKYLH